MTYKIEAGKREIFGRAMARSFVLDQVVDLVDNYETGINKALEWSDELERRKSEAGGLLRIRPEEVITEARIEEKWLQTPEIRSRIEQLQFPVLEEYSKEIGDTVGPAFLYWKLYGVEEPFEVIAELEDLEVKGECDENILERNGLPIAEIINYIMSMKETEIIDAGDHPPKKRLHT